MKNSYQSKPIPLFTHYNGEYSKLQLKLRFHFPALHRQTRQAAHSFRRNACAHHTLGNSFFFHLLYLTWCKMRSHFLAFLSQDKPLSPYDKPEPMMRVVKGIFVTRDRSFLFPVKCEMANFFLVNRDFHSSREAWFWKNYFPWNEK